MSSKKMLYAKGNLVISTFNEPKVYFSSYELTHNLLENSKMKLFSNAWINKEDIKKYDVKKITCLKYLFLQDQLYIFKWVL